jgi:hypothetical protein
MNESAHANDRDTSLLAEILTNEFPPEEKERIGRALSDTESMPARILMSSPRLIHDHKFWGRAQRKFGVNGFRPGAPAAIPKVVSRVLDAARSHATSSSTAWPNIWPLYERAALAYIDHDRLALSRLLRKEQLQAGEGSRTDKILRSIVKYMPLYDVPLEHVRELYELWGFERTNLLEEILSDRAVRADTVRRMIDDSLAAQQKETLRSIAAERTERDKLLASYSGDLDALRTEITELRNDVEQACSEWRSAAQMHKAIGSSPEIGAHRERDLTSETGGPHANPRDAERSTAEFELLHTRVESLGKQLKDIRRRLDQGAQTPHADEESPSAAATSTPPTCSQVLQVWRSALVATGAPNSAGLARVVLEMIRRSRVLLTARPAILKQLFSASFPEAQIRITAASPLWISDADWKEDFVYLQQSGTRPRLLIIENFDAAMQDAYLVPPLLTWLQSIPNTSASRVVLVPSVDNLSDVSPRIHEISTCLAHQPPHYGWPQFDEARMKTPPEVQSAADLVRFVLPINQSGERELSQHLWKQRISIPLRLVQGCVNVYDGLRLLLPSREARVIAQDATLIPWGERALGATQLTMLRNALDNLDEH